MNKLIVDVHWDLDCDVAHIKVSRHFYLAFVEALRASLIRTNTELVVQEERHPAEFVCQFERMREVIENLYMLQGEKYSAGVDVTPALEKLVAEYAELKR